MPHRRGRRRVCVEMRADIEIPRSAVVPVDYDMKIGALVVRSIRHRRSSAADRLSSDLQHGAPNSSR
jgi:hypothetical protein